MVHRYLALLSSPIPPTVAFALKALDIIQKHGQLDAGEYFDGAFPALRMEAKATVKLALDIALRCLKQKDQAVVRDLQVQVVEMAAEAMASANAGIQEIALEMMFKLAKGGALDTVLHRLATVIDSLSPSVQKRAALWMVETSPGEARAGNPTILESPVPGDLVSHASAISTDFRQEAKLAELDEAIAALRERRLPRAITHWRTPFPFPDLSRKVEAIPDLETLVEQCAAMIEDPSDVIRTERVLDGISRLCGERPRDFAAMTGPLLKRLEKLCHPYSGELLPFVRCWINGETPSFLRQQSPEQTAFGSRLGVHPLYALRLYQVAKRVVSREIRPLVSFPTHECGIIDPTELVDRLATGPAVWEKDSADITLALLRMAPWGRVEARREAGQIPGEIGDALRYALGMEGVEIGNIPGLWYAACRARSPLEDDSRVERRFPGGGPFAGRAGRTALEVRTRVSAPYTFYDLEVKTDPAAGQDQLDVNPLAAFCFSPPAGVDNIRLENLLWPGNREPFFSMAARAIAANLDWWEARWDNIAFLEPLLEPDAPVGENGLALVVMGLSAKDPRESALATDAIVAGICDGRIDGLNLGKSLARYLKTGLARPPRWAKVLQQAAKISTLHALTIARSLEICLGVPRSMHPKGSDKLLQLLLELLCAEGAVVAHETRQGLAGYTGNSLSAKYARSILGLSETEDRERKVAEAAALALEGRLDRVRRWAGILAAQ